jgi:ABC-type protease/lipase transport system fused ATPase/permease subunit
VARHSAKRDAGSVLQDAIEDVLRVAGKWVWLVLGMGMVTTLLSFALILNRMYIVGYVTVTYSQVSLLSVSILVIILVVVSIGFKYLEEIAISAMSGYAARRLAVPAVLATAQRAGRPETLANGAISDIETLRTSLAGPVSLSAVNLVMTPLLIALVFTLHWAYGAVAFFFCSAAAILGLLITRAAATSAKVSSNANARAYALAADAMRSGEAVLAMGMLPRLARQWIGVSTETAGEAWLAERRAARLQTVLNVVMSFFRGSILMLGAALMLLGENVTAVLAGALFIMARLTDPFVSLGNNARDIGEGLSAWRRLRALVDGSPMPPEGIAFPCPEGRMVAERLSFTYRGPQPTLLRNIELTVRPGEIVAIIGASGSGKSTLLRLLVGMYRPGSGGCYLDGHATHQWDRRDLARHVGFLPQDPLLSRGTAAEVIARLEVPDMNLVLDAAKRAGAHDTIVGLPLGYATEISGSFQLSMGQRHRIALARALYGRPKLLLFDELAGSLDTEGEAAVATLLGVLREEGSAVVFTTHRPSLLAAADRVLTLRHGALVPTGGALLKVPGPKPPAPLRLGRQPAVEAASA